MPMPSIIGSEMIGLTKIKDENNTFPAIEEFVNLAKKVKSIVGDAVKVTYAADWSEYHHTSGGWYNLDPLWACEAIDFIGIDAYFPLTEGKVNNFEYKNVIKGWQGGEGYDYYIDGKSNKKFPISPQYAWKNIDWWWKNKHINPDGIETSWKPKSKKIWFTEYGFPSVDCATNQPNVFYDKESSESGLPKSSSGQTDYMAQRMGIYATEKKWLDSEMIENKFLWTWDARPYPFWPDLKQVWGDGANWHKGHWVQGKLGMTTLKDVVYDLAKRVNINKDDLSIDLNDCVEGMVINQQIKVSSILSQLKKLLYV